MHSCWFEHSDLSFGNGFLTSDYGFGMLITTLYFCWATAEITCSDPVFVNMFT